MYIDSLQNVAYSFMGCIRNFTVGGKALPSPSQEVEVQPCTTTLEQGSFFYSDGGYVQMSKYLSFSWDLFNFSTYSILQTHSVLSICFSK